MPDLFSSINLNAPGAFLSQVLAAFGPHVRDATFTLPGATVARSAGERAGDWLNALDFIPRTLWAGILSNTSTTDCKAYMQAALAAGKRLVLPPGTIRVSGALDMIGSDRQVLGSPGSRIESTNNAEPVIKVGGLYQVFSDFAVSHVNMPTTLETGANGIEFFGSRFSIFSKIRVEKNYNGLYLSQTPYVDGNRNYIFSNVFIGTDIRRWRNAAIDMRGYLAGNTGCAFINTYLNNYTFNVDLSKHLAPFFLQLDGWAECHFHQLNLEHGEVSNTPINIGSSCRTMNFDALHMEGVDMKSGSSGMIRNNGGCQVSVRGWDIYKCKMLAADVSSVEFLRLGTNSRFTIDGLTQTNGDEPTLRDLPISIAVYGGSTSTSGAKIEGRNIKADNIQVVIVGQPSGIEPILYWWETARDRAVAAPGNASFSLSATTPAGVVIFDTPLSANRTLTLTSCTPRNGHRLEVWRTAGATGAFSIDVGGFKSLTATGQSAQLIYRNGAWALLQ